MGDTIDRYPHPRVRYIDFDKLDLDVITAARTKSLVERNARKLCRHVHTPCGLTVHIKAYNAAGAKRKYSVHMRFTAPGMIIVSDKAHGWNLRTAIHEVCDGFEARLKERLAKVSYNAQESVRRRTMRRTTLARAT